MLEDELNEILLLYYRARERNLKPWELQDELKSLCSRISVVAVGDDLSITLRLERDLDVDEAIVERLGGKRTRIYPFKRAYRFERGFFALEGRFIRISREIEENILLRILRALRER
jgi:hypothetical protein